MSQKLVLIDGHSILNRAFYGVPDLTNHEGIHTNAVYGFLNILFKILDEEKPDYLTVAFDVKAPTFRHEMFKDYKGTRKPMPDELREQVPIMKEVLKAMEIPIMEQAGLEADDILGTLAKKAEKDGMEVSLVSGDRDLLQIASSRIKIRIPKTKMGRTEIEDYYEQNVLEKYQVTPTQFIDVKALMGDTADNIPGVPKVGEKTATGLIVEYGSVDGIYANIEGITKKSIKESLIENKELAYLSKTLATIKTDCEINLDYEKAKAEGYFTQAAFEWMKRLEFKNMLQKFDSNDIEDNKITDVFVSVDDLNSVENIFDQVSQIKCAAIYCLSQDRKLYGVAICYAKEKVAFIPVGGFITEDYLKDKIQKLFGQCQIVTYDCKSQYPYLGKPADIMNMKLFDIAIGTYLVNPLKGDYPIEDIANEYLGLTVPERATVFGKKRIAEVLEEDAKKVYDYACYFSYIAYACNPILQEKLQEMGMSSLLNEIEMPLSYVLYDMEQEGIHVKKDDLKEFSKVLAEEIGQLEKKIYEFAGEEFNINSPKQLGEILFVKLEIPGGKKTKTGYSTAADVLEKLAVDYPIVESILQYRTLSKLKSTYADGLVNYIEEDGKIHTNFNQTITATGRISSTEPNLQNIPMRLELGRQIRKVFVPEEGNIFVDADYSQIELRVLAHMSADEQLIEAYKMDEDIHRITASKVFNTPFDEVTDLQRRNAKAVNFGIVYGISSFGLSQDLSISKKQAAEYIEQYFKTYPQIKVFLDKLVSDTKEQGYVSTMFGRRRPVPEISSSNFMQRSFGERIAMNSPIQGTAADIIKIAMIRVYNRLLKENLKAKLILQVHDELLIEAPVEEEVMVQKILREEMEQAVSLSVTLQVDMHSGNNWYETK